MNTKQLIYGMESSYSKCLNKLRTDNCSYIENIFVECLAIARNKNADYSSEDALENFNEIENIIPWITAEAGIIVRISDKLKRIGNLVNKEPSVKDEKFEDSCLDAINYLAILIEVRRNRKYNVESAV